MDRGLYRLPSLPMSEHDDLIRATFWSRDRTDTPQAVVSHRTALALHGLSDLFAGTVYLTVPPGFRKHPPPGWVLHRAELDSADIEEREGFRVTKPIRTLADAANSDDVGADELAKAIRDALERGIVSRKKLVQAAQRAAADRLLRTVEEEAA